MTSSPVMISYMAVSASTIASALGEVELRWTRGVGVGSRRGKYLVDDHGCGCCWRSVLREREREDEGREKNEEKKKEKKNQKREREKDQKAKRR